MAFASSRKSPGRGRSLTRIPNPNSDSNAQSVSAELAIAKQKILDLEAGNRKLQTENSVLGKAMEELLQDRKTPEAVTLKNVLSENAILKNRLTSWRARALAEGAVVDELREVSSKIMSSDYELVAVEDAQNKNNKNSTASENEKELEKAKADLLKERQKRAAVEDDRRRDLVEIARLEEKLASVGVSEYDRIGIENVSTIRGA